MPRRKIPSKFDQWADIWNKWHLELSKNNLNAVEECLLYPMSLSEVNCVIVGVDNLKHLKNLIEISKNNKPSKDWSFMISNDPMLINPTNWKKF